jgi:hypothetical protein
MFESEVELVWNSFGLKMYEFFDVNDIYITRLLQKNKLSVNFDKKFHELKMKKAKQGKK